MPKIHSVHDTGNKFCGPAALSALTGLGTLQIERKINHIRRKPDYYKVEGCYVSELIQVLENLDYEVEMKPSDGSLFWQLSTIRQDGLYLVCVPHHFVVLDIQGNNRYLVDNHTKSPINAGSSARLQQQVQGVYRIWRDKNKEVIENMEAWGL